MDRLAVTRRNHQRMDRLAVTRRNHQRMDRLAVARRNHQRMDRLAVARRKHQRMDRLAVARPEPPTDGPVGGRAPGALLRGAFPRCIGQSDADPEVTNDLGVLPQATSQMGDARPPYLASLDDF
jgi:hypothetical protein